jgi:hypothetical protein
MWCWVLPTKYVIGYLRGDGRGFEQRFDVGDGEVQDADPRARRGVDLFHRAPPFGVAGAVVGAHLLPRPRRVDQVEIDVVHAQRGDAVLKAAVRLVGTSPVDGWRASINTQPQG